MNTQVCIANCLFMARAADLIIVRCYREKFVPKLALRVREDNIETSNIAHYPLVE